MKISFVDFWEGFDAENNFITDSFRRIVDTQIVAPNDHPDILVYSIFGYENLYHHDCIRIYYTGENDVPDFNLCDYGISFHNLNFGNRHLRLPLYATWPSFELLRRNKRMSCPETRGFCSFVVSNNFCASPLRNEMFERLNEYRPIASGGRYANNIGGPVKDKLKFLNKYKFNIAFENSSVPGYTTEKIFDALAAKTIPIYWGDPNVINEVNTDSFINISDFSSFEDAIQYIKKIDNEPDLYKQILETNPISDNSFLNWENQLDDFLLRIITNPQKYVPQYGLGASIHLEASSKAELYHCKPLLKFLKFYKRVKNFTK